MVDTILETKGLTKHYGGVHALEGANFVLSKGEHVAIVGDNGAGKSTFVRQITGVEQPTSGTIWFDGRDVAFENPLRAREAGIETVFQNLALADDLDVPSNLSRPSGYAGTRPHSTRAMRTDHKGAREDGMKIPNL
jgi:fructose transport system ATP-binding protein